MWEVQNIINLYYIIFLNIILITMSDLIIQPTVQWARVGAHT